jgi:septal ring factor EnvC (AmiA/AmiB activator)
MEGMMLDRTAHNRLAALADSRLGIGGNNPPGPIDFANESIAALSDWMKDHPVVESLDNARAAKLLADRAKRSLDTIEDERDKLVRPLNEEVATINSRYRPIRTALEKVLEALKKRLTAYAKALETERLRQAEEARRLAEAAEAAAREAEALEREAAEDASQGVCDVDIGAATIAADDAFARPRSSRKSAPIS